MNRKRTNEDKTTTMSDADAANNLIIMKNEIDAKKTTITTMQGERDVYYKTLRDKFGLSDIPEADQELAALGKEIDTKKKDLNTRVQQLYDDFNWDFQNA